MFSKRTKRTDYIPAFILVHNPSFLFMFILLNFIFLMSTNTATLIFANIVFDTRQIMLNLLKLCSLSLSLSYSPNGFKCFRFFITCHFLLFSFIILLLFFLLFYILLNLVCILHLQCLFLY